MLCPAARATSVMIPNQLVGEQCGTPCEATKNNPPEQPTAGALSANNL